MAISHLGAFVVARYYRFTQRVQVGKHRCPAGINRGGRMTTPDDPAITPAPASEPKPDDGDIPRTFTQAEFNRGMGQARSAERAKFADYAALQERAKVADQLEQASLSEKDKLERRTAEAERRLIDADARIADTAISSEVRVKAVQRGIVDPDAAYALIDRARITHSDDEGVTGVDEALESLLADKPYLKGNPTISPPNLNHSGGSEVKTPVKLTDAQRSSARRFKMTEEEYAKNLNPG